MAGYDKLWLSLGVSLQYTGETLGQADKTELDPELETLLARADATKTWTDKIIAQTEVLLQPNPGQTDSGICFMFYFFLFTLVVLLLRNQSCISTQIISPNVES